MRRKLLGPEHPDVAANLKSLAVMLSHKRDYDAAEALHREALAIRRKSSGGEHPDVADSLGALGATLAQKGDLAAAEPLFREALTIQRKLSGPHGLPLARALHNLSAVLQRNGDHAGAEPPLRESMTIHRDALGAEHPLVAEDLIVLANLSARLGRFPQALSDVEAYVKVKPDDHVAWFLSACLRLYLGDAEGYRRDCSEMIIRFGEGAPAAGAAGSFGPLAAIKKLTGSSGFDPRVADRTAKTCLLLPDALPAAHQKRLMKLMDRAVGSDDQDVMPFFMLGKGIAEYRAGHGKEAVEWLARAREGMGPEGAGPATAELFLAMANHSRGDVGAAREGLSRATQLIDTSVPRAGEADLGGWPQDWLICQIALREAKATIGSVR